MSARPSPRPATAPMSALRPFADFVAALRPQVPLRAAITAAYRRPEPDCLAPLLDLACMPNDAAAKVSATARRLVEALRSKTRQGGVEGLIQEYSLSSAGRRGADVPRRGAAAHSGHANARRAHPRQDRRAATGAAISATAPSLFVNAATWGSSSRASSPRPPARQSLSAVADPPHRARRRAGDPQGRRTSPCG